ncbi:MAG: hypothetical protein ACYCWN_01050 [Ferrimicrobium sp.]|jgi:hypothetical protein|uniref:Uncharacterized protein n=1 Tax=Ferrimicrobium acidiphilum TaxID=121039 RepID=A0ABV3Y3Y2_9ACTN|nr:hypothetical protein [Ferrimicrobium sp.]
MDEALAPQQQCVIKQPVSTSRYDALARKILRVPQVQPTARREEAAERLFSLAMVISGLRCTLSYVIVPFILPALGIGALAGLSPEVGIPIGVAALFFDVKGIRRFWLANHKWRWQMSFIYLAVIGLVLYLVIADIIQLL